MNALLRAGAGLAGWLVFVVLRAGPDLRGEMWTLAWLLFAVLVLVPLAIELFREPSDDPVVVRAFTWLERLQLPAALALGVACWLPAGLAAGVATLPWLAVTVGFAGIGVRRLRLGLRRDLDGLCRDVALIFALVGATWALLDRSGLRPLGFDAAIVALTAVHFHYAGFLLPLFAGLVQAQLFFLRLASRAVVGVILGVPAVALGITVTQLKWGTSLESAAGCGLALAGMIVATLQVRIASDGRQRVSTRALLAVSGIALFISMVLAASYALRGTQLLPALALPQMRLLHGGLNALGFGLAGVLAWRGMAREPAPA